jgi:hypothetical protein
MKKSVIMMMSVCLAAIAVCPVFAGPSAQASGRSGAAGGDLKGFNLKIATFKNWTANTFGPESLDITTPRDAVERNILAWRTKSMKDHNFTVTGVKLGDSGSYAALLAVSLVAGDPPGDIFWINHRDEVSIVTLYSMDLLAPISTAPGVDLTKSSPVNYNRKTLPLFTYKGAAYGFSIDPGLLGDNLGLKFSNSLLREAGIEPDTIYDMQKNGTWTWAEFEKILQKCSRDIDNDGKIDVYGIATHYLGIALAASNNAPFVTVDASGKFVHGINKPEFLAAYAKMKEWYSKKYVHESIPSVFKAAWESWSDTNRADEDTGFVVFPKGPNAPRYMSFTDSKVYAIPSSKTPQEVSEIMYAFEQWVQQAPGNDADSWKTMAYRTWANKRIVDETLPLLRNQDNLLEFNPFLIPGLAEFSGLRYDEHITDGRSAQQLVEENFPFFDSNIAEANRIIGK